MSVPTTGTNRLCPKCEAGFFGAPTYVPPDEKPSTRENWAMERLERTCSVCGYKTYELTRDAK